MIFNKIRENLSSHAFFLELIPIVLANMLISLVISFPLFKSSNAAIIGDEFKIVFPTEIYNMGTLEVRRKTDYTLIENQKEIIKQKRDLFFDIAKTMSEFYQN